MLQTFAKYFFGSANERFIKPLYKRVERINQLESELEKLTEEKLREKTILFREQIWGEEVAWDGDIWAFST